jgi:hypothetical protein
MQLSKFLNNTNYFDTIPVDTNSFNWEFIDDRLVHLPDRSHSWTMFNEWIIRDYKENLLHTNPQQKKTISYVECVPKNDGSNLTDEVSKRNCTLACHGDLLYNSYGKWIKVYTQKVVVCDAFLDLSWREGISNLSVESDSNFLIDLVINKCKLLHKFPFSSLNPKVDDNLYLKRKHNENWFANFSPHFFYTWAFFIMKTPLL